MTSTASLHLTAATAAIAVAGKSQRRSLILAYTSSKITFSNHKYSLQALLRPTLSISPSRLRIFSTAFSESHNDEEPVEPPQADEDAAAEHKQRSAESRRLYVGNLSFSMTSSELSEIFSQAGKVGEVEMIYGRSTNRSRGFAFVTMSTAEEANEAIRMFDGVLIGGRTLKVNFPEVPRGGEREVMGPKLRANSGGYVNSPHKIYAGNLGWKVTSESLRDAFSVYSGLLGARVIYERDSGRSRGFGFVTFASAAECQAALEAMNGKLVAGRPLRLNLASDKSLPETPLLATVSASLESHGEDISVDQERSMESNLV
ncbi:33 kDa ribonucleoprotein, chloroplastic [Phalaenopsis equestris]|uniref:33 kDa ribonucleoprotein, chloroplastic n=1 Tax=Phalaenopsis equestris TaxID=78828 RepID=UPI0009E3E3BF|nr:33 kDa ribonucleoprotein, chloroplastic [Phalaenopsis equestris]